jgi:hypothetical protein
VFVSKEHGSAPETHQYLAKQEEISQLQCNSICLTALTVKSSASEPKFLCHRVRQPPFLILLHLVVQLLHFEESAIKNLERALRRGTVIYNRTYFEEPEKAVKIGVTEKTVAISFVKSWCRNCCSDHKMLLMLC